MVTIGSIYSKWLMSWQTAVKTLIVIETCEPLAKCINKLSMLTNDIGISTTIEATQTIRPITIIEPKVNHQFSLINLKLLLKAYPKLVFSNTIIGITKES